MRYARIGNPGSETPAVYHDGDYFDISAITTDIDGAFLASDRCREVASALADEQFPRLPLGRIGSPIARPGALVCIGMNYVAHAAETGSPPPASPVVFLKTPNTVVGPEDTVTIPQGSVRTDYEVELGVVIGKPTHKLHSPQDSRKHIAGFVLANDLSERDWQFEQSGGQWSKGKCAPGFNPTGPWLVTPDAVNHQDLLLSSRINGQTRQASSTADMIFDVDYIVWHLSQFMALDPGDLIMTGTPEGVALSGRFPYLQAGDICEVEISGLGSQRTEFH